MIDGSEGNAETIDFSASGIGFFSNEYLSRKTPLEMRMDLPDRREPLCLQGEVTWSQFLPNSSQKRVGASFRGTKLPEAARILRLQRARENS